MSRPRRQREDWPLPPRGRWLRYFGIGIAVLASPWWFCIPPIWLVERYVLPPPPPPIRDPARLRTFFRLPPSATILSGQYEGSFGAGYYGSIRFTLPNIRTPSQWTASIARTAYGSRAAKYQNTAIDYGRIHRRAGYRIRLIETDSRGRRIYEAESGWN